MMHADISILLLAGVQTSPSLAFRRLSLQYDRYPDSSQALKFVLLSKANYY
jgi:hypothetical protein